MKRKTLAIGLVVTLGLGTAAAAWLVGPNTQPVVEAADHNDPPGRVTGASADRAGDIGDLYTFLDGENTVFVLTYAGPELPVDGQSAVYDGDVLYQIWVDVDGADSTVPDTGRTSLDIRFGQNDSGNWGMQVTNNLTGTPVTLTGATEHMNSEGGVTYWAGLRDDPFFFDLTGFGETVSTGDLAFMGTRDGFAGANISAIVISVPNAQISSDTFDTWATTARITGS
ncbi:MAG: DUF4331 family protein [Sandaracinaceae bacterium]